MSTFILIHGAFHGGWCWAKVVPLLEKAGHRVLAPDLPGHGKDKTPLDEVTLEAYERSVCRLLDQCDEPVVLVGHSMGGGVITRAAELRPNRIQKLIYLTAVLPVSGGSIKDLIAKDTGSVSKKHFILSADKKYLTVEESGLKESFYGDCSDEDIELARASLVPQATAPLRVPIRWTGQNFGRVPRDFIQCLQDKALTPEFQKRCYTQTPCRRILTLNTSHSSFFSAPEKLVECLVA